MNLTGKKRPKNWYRTWFQAAWFALTNGYYQGYASGTIFTGPTKRVCVPGLNCYSCPGALYACPIGSLQAVLDSGRFSFSCYVFGLLMAFGALMGRFVCGWLCPFGLVQDLVYKIPTPKKRKNAPGHKYLRWLRFVILAVFVLLLPALFKNDAGTGQPWFCEFICPSGTLLGGFPLALMNEGLRAACGPRFAWKTFLLVIFIVSSLFYWRPFCKYICPLGALYGCTNSVAAYRFRVNEKKCVSCGACQRACKVDIPVWQKPNSIDCVRCGDCKAACPTGAITSTWEEFHAKWKAEHVIPDPDVEEMAAGSSEKAAKVWSETDAAEDAEKTAMQSDSKRMWIGRLILAVAVVMIVIGCFTGETNNVIQKAANICMECIGIG